MDLDKPLKLDLHTHCLEATRFQQATVETVGQLVAAAKAAGLDGFAVTEHMNYRYSFKVKEIVEANFGDELLIIPGQEIYQGPHNEVVELFLPNGFIFRFLAHPNHRFKGPIRAEADGLNGVEIENHLHNWHIEREHVLEFAQQHGLMLLRNSDAHEVKNIGARHNELPLGELFRRAEEGGRQWSPPS